jgi:hypothetical protein
MWGYWPEVMPAEERLDYNEYAFNIGDSVELFGPHIYDKKGNEFYENHKNDWSWNNSVAYSYVFWLLTPDSANINSIYGVGVVKDRWVYKGVRYYKVTNRFFNYASYYTETRVRVREELRLKQDKIIDWNNGGSYE